MKCNNKINLIPVKEKIKLCEEQLREGIVRMDEEKPERAVPLLCQALDDYHRYLLISDDPTNNNFKKCTHENNLMEISIKQLLI